MDPSPWSSSSTAPTSRSVRARAVVSAGPASAGSFSVEFIGGLLVGDDEIRIATRPIQAPWLYDSAGPPTVGRSRSVTGPRTGQPARHTPLVFDHRRPK